MSLCINPDCRQPTNQDRQLFCQSCGSELLLAGKYRVRGLLSDKGGFGCTYEAASPNLGEVVLKVLTHSHPHAVELFNQEAQVLTSLNHPGIPKGLDHFLYYPRDRSEPLHCLIMTKVLGLDLEAYQEQRQNRPIDEPLAIAWLGQLVAILHEVHQRQFFHRDIKPSNIILQPDGQLALIDFGSVRQMTQTILRGGQNTGIYTPGFAPPEQERGFGVPQSDFFALGRTFVYLLTGKFPTDPVLYDHYNNELRWRSQAQISKNLADFLDWLMADRPKDRPQDTTLLRTAVEKLQRGQSLQNLVSSQTIQAIPPTVVTPEAGQRSAPIAQTPPLKPMVGFWRRNFAGWLDMVILCLLCGVIGGFTEGAWMIDFYGNRDEAIGATVASLFLGGVGGLSWLVLIGIAALDSDPGVNRTFWIALLGFVMRWLYFTWLESSPLQGTFGKAMLGITVGNRAGERLTWGQANKRFFSKFLCLLGLGLGFLAIGWSTTKQGWHDRLAGAFLRQRY